RAGREGVAITLAEPREHRLLKNIERVARHKIEISKVPTVADLRARRLDLTAASLREAIMEGGFDEFQVIVDSLSNEYDIVDIALAAVKLAHDATTPTDESEQEIPEAFVRPGAGAPRAAGRRSAGNTARVFVGAGRQNGIRPKDLVGAITGEAGIRGSEIGAIEIADRFSLVEVSTEVVDRVIDALRNTTVKGKRVTARLDKEKSRR
ncbi:MAG TPA: DbpA RNA binding domain-containing protein, partial [Longimicrobiales bacterium]